MVPVVGPDIPALELFLYHFQWLSIVLPNFSHYERFAIYLFDLNFLKVSNLVSFMVLYIRKRNRINVMLDGY